MSKVILLFFAFFSVQLSFGQLTEGNWLFGGSGYLQSNTRDYIVGQNIVKYKDNDVAISPSVGYFIINKLAIGVKPSFSWSKSDYVRTISGNVGGGQENNSWFYIGPFGRYYFLQKDNIYNIVVDASYSYGMRSDFGKNVGRSNSFKFMTGPVLYFNSSVGIELLIGYSSTKQKFYDNLKFSNNYRGFLTTIGFQIHLESEK